MGSTKPKKLNPDEKHVFNLGLTHYDLLHLAKKILEAAVILQTPSAYPVKISKKDSKKFLSLIEAMVPDLRGKIGVRKRRKRSPNGSENRIKFIQEDQILDLFPELKKILKGVEKGLPEVPYKERVKLTQKALSKTGIFLEHDSEELLNAAIKDEHFDKIDISEKDEIRRSDELAKESLALIFGTSRSTINRIINRRKGPVSLVEFLSKKTLKGTKQYEKIILELHKESRRLMKLKQTTSLSQD